MTDVPLREYIERIIQEHDKAHQAEHKAVQLQAAEYERRLDALNHAHREALRVQNTYVRSDKFETWQEGIETELDKREERFRSLENFRAKAGLIALGIATFSGVVGAAIMRAFS